jgi:hypothetical protein
MGISFITPAGHQWQPLGADSAICQCLMASRLYKGMTRSETQGYVGENFINTL